LEKESVLSVQSVDNVWVWQAPLGFIQALNNGDEKMIAQKILTKHPSGKSGRNIDRKKYDNVKGAIVSALKDKELTHTELFNQLNKSLRSRFSGNISWYGETVKLDLEARKIIERTASKPQKYRLKSR
jgi:hypothetical protein